jgi:hypothetical protein
MTIRAGQIGTPDGYVQAVVNIDPTTGSPATTDGLTNAQLRATPVPVSGPLTDAQLRATSGQTAPVYTAQGAFPTAVGKQFAHALWTDGTVNGADGGAFALAGDYSVTPRIVYRTFTNGAIIRRFAYVMTGSGTLTLTGWGTGAALTNGLRFEVVASDPTNAATAATFRAFPSGTGTATLVRGLGELMLLGNQADIDRQNTAAFVTVEAIAPGGLYVPAGSSFRVVVNDNASVGVTAFAVRIMGHELG